MCIDFVCISPLLTVPNVWIRPPNMRKEADQAKKLLEVPDGDHLTLLNVYNNYAQSEFTFSFYLILPANDACDRWIRSGLDIQQLPQFEGSSTGR